MLSDFAWPSPAYVAGTVLFGLIGYAAFRYGRKNERSRTTWIGVTLMLYPYVVPFAWLLYVVGIALCMGLWLDRD